MADDYYEWADRKGLLKFSDDESQVHELIARLEKQESDRLIIARALAGLFEEEKSSNPNALKEFKSNFQKLESLVSLRNIFAHEYYRREHSGKTTESISQGGIDLIKKLISHLTNA